MLRPRRSRRSCPCHRETFRCHSLSPLRSRQIGAIHQKRAAIDTGGAGVGVRPSEDRGAGARVVRLEAVALLAMTELTVRELVEKFRSTSSPPRTCASVSVPLLVPVPMVRPPAPVPMRMPPTRSV